MSLGTSNRDGGKTSESGHLRFLLKAYPNGGVLQGLNATQRGAGANMSVDLQIGDGIIPRADNTYGHPVFNDAVLNKSVTAADGSNPRRDILVMYIDYNQAPDSGVSNNTNGVVNSMIVAGTAAGSPSDPSDVAIQAAVGSGNPFIKIARIRVGTGVTSIGDSVIDDLRTMASPVMGYNSPAGFLLNGKIVTSVATNDLTVAVKTISGNDPSDTDPVYVRIGNTVRKITAALSLTKNDGTNWFGAGGSMFATLEIDYFVYFIWNTVDRAVSIGFARIPYGRTYADFSATSTNEKYLAYSGSAPNSTDEVEVGGRFNAILSATAAFNWSLPATSIIIQRPIHYSRFLRYIPTWTGFSAGPTDATGMIAYRIMDNVVDVDLNPQTSGTSNNSAHTVSLPFSSRSNEMTVSENLRFVDNGGSFTATGLLEFGEASATATLYTTSSGGGWTASGVVHNQAHFRYLISNPS